MLFVLGRLVLVIERLFLSRKYS